MFDRLKALINQHTYSELSEINEILENFVLANNGNEYFESVAKDAVKHGQNMKRLYAFRKKTAHTERWQKKYDTLHCASSCSLSSLILGVNRIHCFQTILLKLIWLTENKQKNELTRYSQSPSSFSKLLGEISLFDSSDRERLKVFNRFRNVISHSQIEHLTADLNKEITDDISELCMEIHSMNEIIQKNYREKLAKVIISELKHHDLSSSEYSPEFIEYIKAA